METLYLKWDMHVLVFLRAAVAVHSFWCCFYMK